jgi:DNA polymerase III subunit epsilon
MRLWEVLELERPLVGVDLETTGTNVKSDGIVSLSLEIMVPGQPVREYSTLVNPLLRIPAEATAIHGITDEMVKDAPTFRKLRDNLLLGFADCDFAGMSILTFDLPMLAEEFSRAGIVWTYEDRFAVDAYRIEQILNPRKLENLAAAWLTPEDREELGEQKAHDARWDVRASTRVAANQIVQGGLPRRLADLHAACWPDRYDVDGKLRFDAKGRLCITFGEHRGKPLEQVGKGYLNWMLGKDFSGKVKTAIRQTLAGSPIKKEPCASTSLPASSTDTIF